MRITSDENKKVIRGNPSLGTDQITDQAPVILRSRIYMNGIKDIIESA
jgi:hypothetical protein